MYQMPMSSRSTQPDLLNLNQSNRTVEHQLKYSQKLKQGNIDANHDRPPPIRIDLIFIFQETESFVSLLYQKKTVQNSFDWKDVANQLSTCKPDRYRSFDGMKEKIKTCGTAVERGADSNTLGIGVPSSDPA